MTSLKPWFKTHAEAVKHLVTYGYNRAPGNDYWTNPKRPTYWAQVKPYKGDVYKGGYYIDYF